MDLSVLSENIGILNLSARTLNCLHHANINILKDLVIATDSSLLRLPRFGIKCLNEIEDSLKKYNLTLNMTDIEESIADEDVLNIKDLYPDQSWLARGNNSLWLKSLMDDNPSISKEIANLNILNDLDYQVMENSLPVSIREVVALYRADYLRPSINNEEVSNLCRIIPPWELHKKLSKLNLPVRTDSRLRSNNIIFIFHLNKISNRELTSIPGFGKTSVDDLRKALNKLSIEIDLAIDLSSTDINKFIERLLSKLDEKEAMIFKARLGYSTNYRTLEETASDFKLTRERIRQIEARTIDRLEEIFEVHSFLSNKLEKLLDNRMIPLFVESLPIYDPWFRGIENKPWILMRLLFLFEINSCSVSSFNNQNIVHRGPKDFLEIVSRDINSFIKDNRLKRISLDEIVSVIKNKLTYLAPELTDLILSEEYKKCHFSDENGKKILVGYGNSIEASIVKLLEDSDSPMRIQEIVKYINENLPFSTTEAYVRGRVAEFALLFGPSLFGLRKHLNFNDVEIQEIAYEVKKITTKETYPHQWHCDGIIGELEKNNFINIRRLNKYTLCICLILSNEFISLGRLTFSNANHENSDTTHRLEFYPLIEEILEKSNTPMHHKDIISIIEKERGVGKYTQFQAKGRLISTGRNIWGLFGKHVNISEKDFDILINEAKSIFVGNGKLLNEDQILKFISDDMYMYKYHNNIHLLFSLLQRSPLFKKERSSIRML